MATFQKRGKSWRVFVYRQGIRKSASFSTKAEAQAWATKTEAEFLAESRGEIPDKSFGDLLDRYAREVSPTKRGVRWEQIRLASVCEDPLAHVRLPQLASRHFADWRDRRLAKVSAATVLREWNLLSNACTVAVREWHWLKENPLRDVRRPKQIPPRDRRISEQELERLLWALGYDHETMPMTISARVGAAMLFAIETAMRAGEICALQWNDVFLEASYLKIRGTGNGGGKTLAAKRDVPLTPEALRIIKQLQSTKGEDNESVFQLSTSQIDALFRKAKKNAMIEDLHFHDTRHEAITRLAAKLDVLELARMVGHRDLRMLMVYYNETASNLAAKLAK